MVYYDMAVLNNHFLLTALNRSQIYYRVMYSYDIQFHSIKLSIIIATIIAGADPGF